MNPEQCGKIREWLDAYISRELPPESVQQVAAHLRECPACAAEYDELVRLRSRLRDAVRATPVPPRLETRVRSTFAGERARPRTGVWAVVAAAAVIVCAVMIQQLTVVHDPEQAILHKASGRLAAIVRAGLRDHLECAVFRKYPRTPDPAAEMTAELGHEFADLLPLVSQKLWGDYRVIQAHICEAGGRHFTHFIIVGGPHASKTISVLLTRKEPGESVTEGIYQTGVDRFQVVTFQSHDYIAYVISDMDPQNNLQLAATLAPALRKFLTRS